MNKQFNVIACMNANFAIGNEGKNIIYEYWRALQPYPVISYKIKEINF